MLSNLVSPARVVGSGMDVARPAVVRLPGFASPPESQSMASSNLVMVPAELSALNLWPHYGLRSLTVETITMKSGSLGQEYINPGIIPSKPRLYIH